jgi:hypothetical protein
LAFESRFELQLRRQVIAVSRPNRPNVSSEEREGEQPSDSCTGGNFPSQVNANILSKTRRKSGGTLLAMPLRGVRASLINE